MAAKLAMLALLALRSASLTVAVPPDLNTNAYFVSEPASHWPLMNNEAARVVFRIANGEDTPVTISSIYGTITSNRANQGIGPIDYNNYQIPAQGRGDLNFTFTPSFDANLVPDFYNVKITATTSLNGENWDVVLVERFLGVRAG